MSDTNRGNPLQVAVVVVLLVGGGWYFFQNYQISGFDEVSVRSKSSEQEPQSYISYRDDAGEDAPFNAPVNADNTNPFDQQRGDEERTVSLPAESDAFKHIRIATWALDGFGPTKLASPMARRHLVRVARQFDIIAFQQIASLERDLVPRVVDVINEGQDRYDYVVSKPVGPRDRPEQLAFVFDTTRVRVDRRATYTMDDPDEQFSFDPLVAWFRAAKPEPERAWTFSLVNVRIDLARAPREVAVLPQVLTAVRKDGRHEDDVVLAGLFQADDAYLIPTMGGQGMRVAVRSVPTDIFGRYQTSNLLVDTATTTEFLGRGGVYDFPNLLDLNQAEAETISSQLPVYGEFTAVEGGLY